MFIKRYTITNYETAKHGDRTGQAYQQGGETVKEISIESEGHRSDERRVWDITAAGVSLCARGGEDWEDEDVTNSRGERSGDGQIASRIDQRGPAIKQEAGRKYQWDYNRSDKGLPQAQWDVREIIIERLSLSMSLIG